MAKRVESSGRKPTLDPTNAPPPPVLPPPPQTRAEREQARKLAKQLARKRPAQANEPKPVLSAPKRLIVALGAGIVLWWIASGVGVIDNVENFIGDLLGSEDFEFLSWRILRGATLVGLVVVCLQVVCTVLAAAFYNLFAEMLGGIEMTVVEEEPTGA
jgi:hypothetical protein